MANKYQIDITARDRTAEALKSVNDNFARIGKGTGLEKVTKGFSAIEQRGKAFGGIARSLFQLGTGSIFAGGGLGEAASGAGALADTVGVLGVGLGVVGAGLGAGVLAAYKFEEATSAVGAGIGRLGQVTGLSTDQIQLFEHAMRRFGIAASASDQALQNVGNTMQDAASGRNQSALALMSKLGVTLHRLPNGAIDAGRGLMDLAAAMQRSNPQTRQMIAAQFGLGSVLDFVTASARERESALDQAQRSGAIRTGKQIADNLALQRSIADLKDRWDGLLNSLERNVTLPAISGLDRALKGLDRLRSGGGLSVDSDGYVHVGSVPGSGRSPAAGAPGGSAPPGRPAAAPGDFHHGIRGPKGAALKETFGHVVDYFVAQGWTPEQAAGIAANMQRESGFDMRAVSPTGMPGLMQWDESRRANFAARYGHDIWHSTFSEQLDFTNWELTEGPESRRAGRHLRAARSAREAAQIVNDEYERNGTAGGDRGQLAQNFINGRVHVDVHIKGAPAGSTAVATADGDGVSVGARIAQSLPGVHV